MTNSKETKTISDSDNIKYEITANWENNSIHIEFTNGNQHESRFRYAIFLNLNRFHSYNSRLSKNETVEKTFDISEQLKASKENHTIKVNVKDDSAEFTGHDPITEQRTSKMETPYITNISIEPSTWADASAEVRVTVMNPSIHDYDTDIAVHTDWTRTSREIRFRANSTNTVEVPISEATDGPLDELTDDISGELRLLFGAPDDPAHAFDQASFEGSVDGETEFEREEYEPIESIDSYDGADSDTKRFVDEYGTYLLGGGFVLFVVLLSARLSRARLPGISR